MDQNHQLTNPFEKCQFFDCLNFLFLQPRKAFFYSNAYFAINKNVEKMSFFGQNHGLTPFEKKANFFFFFFLLLGCRVWKGLFFSRISTETFSFPILPTIKTLKKSHFLTKTMAERFFKKAIFRFFYSLFLQAIKAFFLSKISPKTFFLRILPKMKTWNKSHLWTKTME